MNPIQIAAISFLCIFGGAVAGLIFQPFFPASHLSKESVDSIKLGAGLIATMAALILGLLVSSSKGTYDRVNVLINQAAANTLNLDQTLRAIGTQGDPIRAVLHEQISTVAKDIWPEDFEKNSIGAATNILGFSESVSVLKLMKLISELKTSGDAEADLKKNALQSASTINQQRWQIIVEASAHTPLLLVVIPVLWITFLTLLYGLCAQRNLLNIAVLFFCSVSIAGAIFLICQMSTPLQGFIKIPSTPFQTTLKGLSL